MIRQLLVAYALVLPLLPATPAAAAEPDPVDLVRPFVGTQNFGNTFPGASAPFGARTPTPPCSPRAASGIATCGTPAAR